MFPEQEFESEDDESWQVSYLDIITIILGFLIILLSVSQIAKTEFSSLSTLFGENSDRTEYITTPVEEIQEELEALLQPQIEQGRLELIRDLNDIRIRFRSDDFYPSGSATMQGAGLDLLNHVLRAFQQTSYNDFSIDVEGHTDNVPISSDVYPSNWELSTARASNVVKYFNRMGIDENRLEASGFADSRPLIQFDSFGNPFAATKEKNRRVVLRLYYTTEGLQRQATQEALAVRDNQQTNTEKPVTEQNQPVSTAEQLAQEISQISSSNQQRNTAPATDTPTETPTEEEVPNVVNPAVSESDSEDELPFIPSAFDQGTQCGFIVQTGSFQSLSTGFQVAENSENKSGYEFEVSYNNSLYSVRSNRLGSLSNALFVQDMVASSLDDPTVGLVHQCYQTPRAAPGTLTYQIQFGAFRSEENALNYTIDVLEKYGIQTYMNRKGSTYLVVAGPYNSRETVVEQLQSFKNSGVTERIFIRSTEGSVKEYNFVYQLQLASYTSQSEAQAAAQRITTSLGTAVNVTQNNEGAFYVLTERIVDWDEATELFSRAQQSDLNLDPVIYYLEYL
ncbi:MAG: SPOR domain-containing protein [Balneolaceae bacterium]|nr:SPOR domain-containing protein [Balneolaceae bacterium]MBO6547209.1 SPOR domain-containing protein [Balneolaceae bacterium]MBO6647844.1 SPOR domain-containing protein [Balneolaceae bacterium]